MTPEQIQACIDQGQEAWLRGNGRAFSALFSSTGEFIVPGQRWQGPQEILNAFQSFTATKSVRAITIHQVIIQGDCAVVEWTWEEQAIDTGNISQAEDAIVINFQNGYIQRWREYIDTKSVSS